MLLLSLSKLQLSEGDLIKGNCCYAILHSLLNITMICLLGNTGFYILRGRSAIVVTSKELRAQQYRSL